jgi:hypothetical protein
MAIHNGNRIRKPPAAISAQIDLPEFYTNRCICISVSKGLYFYAEKEVLRLIFVPSVQWELNTHDKLVCLNR